MEISMAWYTLLFLSLVAFGGSIFLVRWCFPLPSLEGREPSRACLDTGDTSLGRGIAKLSDGRQGLNGVHLLAEGLDSFAARVLLIRNAERCLDVQYYIWKNDLTGAIFYEELMLAAARGVRVRILLDDGGVSDMDRELAALNDHPNVQIRLFNPFVIRWPKMIGYCIDFPRLNRRMHNKSLSADGCVTIVGGRNIGDEYFDMREDGTFADLDALVVGPVVREVEADFDGYWACDASFPAERLLPRPRPGDLAEFCARARKLRNDARAEGYLHAIERMPFVQALRSGELELEWAPVRMVSDPPEKASSDVDRSALLGNALKNALGDPSSQLCIVSGYFVPTQAGVDALGALAQQGVDVRVFTNSFDATDVWIVHAGYSGYRLPLLSKGVKLFEMRGEEPEGDAKRPRRKILSTGSGIGSKGRSRVLRSSASALHAKTFVVDKERFFIGSFNFDPRSMLLNTELGFVIESPRLAQRIASVFELDAEDGVAHRAWGLEANERGRLVWLERQEGGEERRLTREPGMYYVQRWGVWLLGRLPIEWML